MADISLLEAARVYERLSAKEPEIWWAIIGFEKNKAFVKALGNTPLDKMTAEFSDDAVEFACVRVDGVDPKGSVVSRRTKFAFLQWIGSSASRMVKANSMTIKSAVSNYFRGQTFSLELLDRAEISESDFEKRLRAAGGAHQPDHFEYPHGSDVSKYTLTSQPAASGVSATPVATGKAAAIAASSKIAPRTAATPIAPPHKNVASPAKTNSANPAMVSTSRPISSRVASAWPPKKQEAAEEEEEKPAPAPAPTPAPAPAPIEEEKVPEPVVEEEKAAEPAAEPAAEEEKAAEPAAEEEKPADE